MGSKILLPFQVPTQGAGEEYLCWAAVTSALLLYFRGETPGRGGISGKQARAVCEATLRQQCTNRARLISKVLKKWSLRMTPLNLVRDPGMGDISMCDETVRDAFMEYLEEGTPLILQLTYPDGLNHVVLVGGLRMRLEDDRPYQYALFDPAGKSTQAGYAAPTWHTFDCGHVRGAAVTLVSIVEDLVE